MGGMDLERPLGLAGIRRAVVTQAGKPTVYSRFTLTALYLKDLPDEELVEALVRLGATQSQPLVVSFNLQSVGSCPTEWCRSCG